VTGAAHQQEVEYLCRKHLIANGLAAWRIQWSNSRRTAGSCTHSARLIKLSLPVMSLWTVERCEQTILHEIAHALTPGDHHGYLWAAKCRELGIKPTRCWGQEGEARPPMKFKGVCPKGHVAGMMRMPSSERSCSRCSRGFNRAFLITWTLNPDFGAPARSAAPTTQKTYTTAAQTETPAPAATPSGKAPRCHAPMPGNKICNRVQGHTRGHDAR
jgi:hypothetical protein